MKKRTLLNIPGALEAFAKLHGAEFDKTTGQWYYSGEYVPLELEELVIKELRNRDLHYEISPQCDLCGCHMIVKLNRRTQDPFWSCASYPRCLGKKPWESAGPVHALEIFSAEKDLPIPEKIQPKKSTTEEVKERAKEITLRATQLFKSQHLAKKWLELPKVGLAHKTPLEIMNDHVGCDKVEQLLSQRFE